MKAEKSKRKQPLFPQQLYLTRYTAIDDLRIHETPMDATEYRGKGEAEGLVGVYKLQHTARITLVPCKPGSAGSGQPTT